jgi:iron complex outermembrane receptor protein
LEAPPTTSPTALAATLGARASWETKDLDFRRKANPNPAAASWSNLSSWWNSYNGTIGGAGTFSSSLSKTWRAFTYDVTPVYKITPTDRVFFQMRSASSRAASTRRRHCQSRCRR